MKYLACFATAAVSAALLASLPAGAGTKGGLYDMQRLLNQGHPFAAAAPARAAPAALDAAAPPPPPARGPAAATPRINPVAQRAPAPRYDDGGGGGFTDGWFERLYFSIGGYYHIPDDLDASVAGGGSASIETGHGFMLNAALGKHFTGNIRAEIELAVRQADYDRAVVGAASAGGSGDLNITTIMLNGYYDIQIEWPFVPYLGAGIGVGIIDGTNVSVGAARVLGPDSTEFAYQGIIGASYRVSPRWSLAVETRYLGAGSDYSSVDGGVVMRFEM